jgi:hypothetical protein
MPPPDMQLNLEAARKLIQAAAEIERLTARPLMLKEDLPNVAGFKFIGFDADGNEHECEVRIDPIGCYSVYRIQDDEPFFMAIVAWARHSHDHPTESLAKALTEWRNGHDQVETVIEALDEWLLVKRTVQLDELTKAIKDLKPEYKPQWYGSVRNDF